MTSGTFGFVSFGAARSVAVNIRPLLPLSKNRSTRYRPFKILPLIESLMTSTFYPSISETFDKISDPKLVLKLEVVSKVFKDYIVFFGVPLVVIIWILFN